MIPSDASAVHLRWLIPDRALGRLYCFGGCPCFRFAVRTRAPGQTRRKSWKGAMRLSTDRHLKRKTSEGSLAPIPTSRGCGMPNGPRMSPDVARVGAGIMIRLPLHSALRVSRRLLTGRHDPQMIHSIVASSPRHKHILHRYNEPDRTQPQQSQIIRLKRCAIAIHHLQIFVSFPPQQLSDWKQLYPGV